MQLVASDFQRFADRAGDLLSRERRRLYEQLLGSAPRLLQRYHSHRNFTITQGDAHVWNTFLPRDHQSDDARLFDWDSWRLDVASRDLAYMIAIHWYPDRRQAMERSLLDEYHETLVAHGVSGLRPTRARSRLSIVGALANYDAGVASCEQYSRRDLVEWP